MKKIKKVANRAAGAAVGPWLGMVDAITLGSILMIDAPASFIFNNSPYAPTH